jgi:hypothetical protein
VRVVAAAGCDADVARALGRAASRKPEAGDGLLLTESLGRDYDGLRACTIVAARGLTTPRHAVSVCSPRLPPGL